LIPFPVAYFYLFSISNKTKTGHKLSNNRAISWICFQDNTFLRVLTPDSAHSLPAMRILKKRHMRIFGNGAIKD